jgi:hypothetical protein
MSLFFHDVFVYSEFQKGNSATYCGSDRETNNYTTAVTWQQPVNINRGKVFSVRSVPRCYKQDS